MNLDTIPHDWLALGFLGQGLFSARFFVQWIASERERRSVIPVAFWWLSLVGGFALLAYAFHRGDPVFIVGQGAGLVVYLRNLALIRKGRREITLPPSPSERSTPFGS